MNLSRRAQHHMARCSQTPRLTDRCTDIRAHSYILIMRGAQKEYEEPSSKAALLDTHTHMSV